MLVRVLTSLDDATDRARIQDAIVAPGVLISSVRDGESLWERLSAVPFDLVVISRSRLPAPENRSIRTVREPPGAPDILVLEDGPDPASRAELVASGALAVLDTDLRSESLRESFAAFVERRRGEAKLRLLATDDDYRLGDFVTASPSMGRLISISRRVADSDTTLLLLGETGVGKEWLARAIHAESPRAKEPFIAVNCAAIPEGLIESELFGHKQGSFTGATRDHRGFFELAHRGTIFLDEIGDMPIHAQVKLLRVLQERQIQPVGSETSLDVDVRVMAATNRDPAEDIEEKRLREDLYYRLAVVTLTIPPLRERREDIRALVENHFEIFRLKLRKPLWGIDRDAIQALVAHEWPGNVRELINVMERAVLLSTAEEIHLVDLPEAIARRGVGRAAPTVAGSNDAGGLHQSWLDKPLREARKEMVTAFERRYLSELLRRTGGKINETARQAGITPRALFDRLKQLGLRKEDFKVS